MNSKIVIGFVTLVVILGFLLPQIDFVGMARAEDNTGKGTIENIYPGVQADFQVSASGKTAKLKDTGGVTGTSVVIYPQAEDILLIEGVLFDYNGEEALDDTASTQDEIVGVDFKIEIYVDTDDSDSIDTEGAATSTWASLADGTSPDIGTAKGYSVSEFSVSDTAANGIIALDDGDAASEVRTADAGDCDLEWVTDNTMSYDDDGVYHELWIYIEDDDNYDIDLTGSGNAPGGYSYDDDTNDGVADQNIIKIGFYCMQTYKVLGLYRADTWANVAVYAGAALDWTFKTTTPTGATQDVNSMDGAGTYLLCLGVQWLAPTAGDVAYSVVQLYLRQGFTGDFVLTGATSLKIVSNSGGQTDMTWDIDNDEAAAIADPAAFVPNPAGAWKTTNDLLDTFTNDADATWQWKAHDGTSGDFTQYDVILMYYTIQVGAVQADGEYTCTTTTSSSNAAL